MKFLSIGLLAVFMLTACTGSSIPSQEKAGELDSQSAVSVYRSPT